MRRCVALFSGGVDSTYTAYRAAPDFDKILLVTYIVPGMVNKYNSERSYVQLKRAFPGVFEHRFVDIREFVGAVRGGVGQCVVDGAVHGSMYTWCLGCKLSMVLYTIELCREGGYGLVIDGSNVYDEHALEQSPDIKKLFEKIYNENGIIFSSPFYEERDVERVPGRRITRGLSLYKDATRYRVEYLRRRGLDLGYGVFSQYRRNQHSCVVSVCFNAPRAVVNLVRAERVRAGVTYVEEKYKRYKAIRASSSPIPREQ